MFKVILTVFITAVLWLPSLLTAQNLLVQPESAVYDPLYNRYLVSNWNNGNIVQIDSNGVQSFFFSDLGGNVAGLLVVGNILYAAANNGFYAGLVGFDLHTAEIVEYINVPGVGIVNGLAADTSGYIYATEYSYHKIYKFDPINDTYSIFVNSDLSVPNGMVFDEINNRMLFLNTGISGNPLVAVSLDDSTLTTLYSIGLPQLDGLTKDQFGNYYVSSWATNSIYLIDSSFNNPLEVVSMGHSGPADISYNQLKNVMVVPNYYQNRVDLVCIHLDFEASVRSGFPPLSVDFTGSSRLTVDDWNWAFGDGETSSIQSPTHIFDEPGMYDVSLRINFGDDSVTNMQKNHIIVLADTLIAPEVTGDPGSSIEVEISVSNTVPLNYIKIPVEYYGSLVLTLDSFTTSGCRADHFDNASQTDDNTTFRRATFLFTNDYQSGTPDMEPGTGPVMKLHFTISPSASVGQTAPLELDGYSTYIPRFKGKPSDITVDYEPVTVAGSVGLPFACGDANGDNAINIFDVTFIITYH
jgi:PKD repeat protein